MSSDGSEDGVEASFTDNPGTPPPKKAVLFSEGTAEPKEDRRANMEKRSSPLEDEDIDFVDHYSLRTPSCEVRFQKALVRVYPQRYSQLLIEERFQLDDGRSVRYLDKNDNVKKREFTVKRMSDVTFGLLLLRLTYTLASLFVVGYLFVFALNLLLYVILGIVTELGLTSDAPANVSLAIGSILSLGCYVHGLSSTLVIAISFVSDTWGGHQLMRKMSPASNVTTDWIAFLVYIGIPLFVGACALFNGNDDWYQILLLTWFGCILFLSALYALAVVYFEIKACVALTREIDAKYEDQRFGDGKGVRGLLHRAILLRQVNRWSGSKHVSYIARGNVISKNSVRDHQFKNKKALSEKYDLLAHIGFALAKPDFKGAVTVLDEPVQIYAIDEARGIMPVTTGYSWSLEKIYCRNRQQRRIAVVKGPGAITKSQARSNFACAIVGKVLILFAVSSFLSWMELSPFVVLIASLLIIIFFCLGLRRDYALFKNYRKIHHFKNSAFEDAVLTLRSKALSVIGKEEEEEQSDDDDEENGQSEGLYNVKETYRVTRPKLWLCWVFFALEITIGFLIPFIIFMASGFWSIGLLFLLLSLFSGLRHYLNAPMLLQELGTLDLVAQPSSENQAGGVVRIGRGVVSGKEDSEKKWTEMHRISEIVGTISQARSRKLLNAVFVFFAIVLLALLGLAGATGDQSEENANPTTLLSDFKYEGHPDIRYPTCNVDVFVPHGISPASFDYAFASQVAYKGSLTAQAELDTWFGAEGFAVYNGAIVDEFKRDFNYVGSRTEYRLIEFPLIPGLAVVVVRGTSNAFDALTDLQIWGAAALLQMLRFALPFGDAWTPILHRLAGFTRVLENSRLTETAFYRETTEFVEFVKEGGNYTTLHITGHSLGGGLAIISGAQTGIPAIAISGPNAQISRLTLEPPVTKAVVNSLTFNIIPQRDAVPMIDDRGILFQEIECNAPLNDAIGCHSIGRSVCQLLFACGSTALTGTRPIPCYCHDDFGFPKPIATGNRTYEDACSADANRR
mmetsp:Transcript_69394/g.103256  ORF Transcript_69394/g.103256 Transcript_69394/m.103256 type:complete len:1021 (+) Transcript_69394:57-3119(+)